MQATGRDKERQDIIRDHIAMMLREVRNLPPAEFQALLESLRPTENTQVEPTRPQTPRTRNRNPCRQCQEQKLKVSIMTLHNDGCCLHWCFAVRAGLPTRYLQTVQAEWKAMHAQNRLSSIRRIRGKLIGLDT